MNCGCVLQYRETSTENFFFFEEKQGRSHSFSFMFLVSDLMWREYAIWKSNDGQNVFDEIYKERRTFLN